MAVIKCKMCGGDLELVEGSSVCECEYCGTKQTVPTADNDKKLTLFARANRLRSANEFDKAAGVYENLVADFPEEAEAYWGLVLCRYGIEYVDDPATGKKIPTCHRSSFDSILEDEDFEQACENADAIARRVYRDEAKAIEDIRRGILEISGKEEPYDIFICYKETDNNGDRTIDSVLAQDVYDALTEKGYRVFFSRVSLEDKLGTEYEPYIFAALNSAKVMLAFGTDYENFNAVWVKNEWSRFLALMTGGQKKVLIPCYKDVDAYDMPKEFQRLQAQDMGKVGAMQDLLRGIEKILRPQEKQQAEAQIQPQTIIQAAGPNVDTLLRRGEMALEDGHWDEATDFFNRVLDMTPESAESFLGLAMASAYSRNRAAFQAAYTTADCSWRSSSYLNRVRQFGDSDLLSWFEQMDREAKNNDDAAQLEREKAAEAERIAREEAAKEEANKRANLEYRKQLNAIASTLISAGCKHLVAVNASGHAFADGAKGEDQCRVADWNNVVAVSAGLNHTVGLKKDGTVVACGSNRWKNCNVKDWYGMIAITARYHDTIGVKKGGTWVSTLGRLEKQGYEVTPDGIVEFVDNPIYRSSHDLRFSQINYWRNIEKISCVGWKVPHLQNTPQHIVGLCYDGSVVAAGDNQWGQCNLQSWEDVIAIATGGRHTVGLRSDGQVYAAGSNDCGQCDVLSWRDVIAIDAGYLFTVGLRSDGKVLVTGDLDRNLWKSVYSWKLFNSIDTLEEERMDAPEQERKERIAALTAEQSSLNAELSTLKGFFSGKRRKEIEAQLANIEAELKKLN